MTIQPIPVVFDPILKPKPWGGRRLAELFGKALPPDEPIGESWELASLPEGETCVRDGPLAGHTLAELVNGWGSALTGDVTLVQGRFPLLIKLLDARENLSVQVHPRPPESLGAGAGPPQAGIKHEAWYVIAADPEAVLYIGFRDGVRPEDAARAAGRREMADLLCPWPVRVGQCFYLPSGTPHALGGGVVVAEVQTPSDVTYRLYDWERVLADGRPRELHIEAALLNVRFDVAKDEIAQRSIELKTPIGVGHQLMSCHSFQIDQIQLSDIAAARLPDGPMQIWIVLSGRGALQRDAAVCEFHAGDTVLIPAAADSHPVSLYTASNCELLAVRVPPACLPDRQPLP